MKLFYKKQNLINELKKLESIKAGDDFKASLFKRLSFENERFVSTETEEYYFKQKPFFKKIFFRKTAPLFMPLSAIIAVIVFIGGGAGMTFASQSALPGEILYSVKIISEKARIALATSDDEKARLHFEFSSKRLNEIAELAEDSAFGKELAEIAVEGYKKELKEGQTALFSAQDGEKAEKAANLLINITSKNKETIARIGSKAKNYKMADSLKDAWEDTIEYNDKAALITLSQPTSSLIVDLTMQKKVFNKIAEAERKIAETNKYLLKKEEKGADISEAKMKIDNAGELLNEAGDFLGQVKYESAFKKAKEAYKIAISAQKIVEHFDGGDDDEDKLEIFKIYHAPDNATTSEEHLDSEKQSFNSTTSEIFNQSASIIDQINIRERSHQDDNSVQLDRNKKMKYDEKRENDSF